MDDMNGMVRLPGRWLFALVFLLVASPSAAGIKVALLPAQQTVAPGDTFDLSIEVTEAGTAFNGFDLSIGFDPTALTFIQRSPVSQQEGAYFVAACPSQRFHQFQAAADSLAITDVLLCANTSVTGPGQIYRLRFKASLVPQVTTVRFLSRLAFYNAGVKVGPVTTTNATVGIGVSLAAPETPRDVPGLRLAAAPNPARGHVVLRIEADHAGLQRLVVTDVAGRVVRRFGEAEFPAGRRAVTWDGRNDSGQVVPPGRYTATLKTLNRSIQTPLTIIR